MNGLNNMQPPITDQTTAMEFIAKLVKQETGFCIVQIYEAGRVQPIKVGVQLDQVITMDDYYHIRLTILPGWTYSSYQKVTMRFPPNDNERSLLFLDEDTADEYLILYKLVAP